MSEVGTNENPLRVAIVGAGPTGFYAAEHLYKHKDLVVEIDMFDRLPTPYGLVRAGVAPDHQKMAAIFHLKICKRTIIKSSTAPARKQTAILISLGLICKGTTRPPNLWPGTMAILISAIMSLTCLRNRLPLLASVM
jgi:hypothetical protein